MYFFDSFKRESYRMTKKCIFATYFTVFAFFTTNEKLYIKIFFLRILKKKNPYIISSYIKGDSFLSLTLPSVLALTLSYVSFSLFVYFVCQIQKP